MNALPERQCRFCSAYLSRFNASPDTCFPCQQRNSAEDGFEDAVAADGLRFHEALKVEHPTAFRQIQAKGHPFQQRLSDCSRGRRLAWKTADAMLASVLLRPEDLPGAVWIAAAKPSLRLLEGGGDDE